MKTPKPLILVVLLLSTLAGAGCQPPVVEAHIEPTGASVRAAPADEDAGV